VHQRTKAEFRSMRAMLNLLQHWLLKRDINGLSIPDEMFLTHTHTHTHVMFGLHNMPESNMDYTLL
jgi:hypothetical protein